MKKLSEIVEAAKGLSRLRVSVAVAEDAEVLQSVAAAAQEDIAEFLLFGSKEKIKHIAEKHNISLDKTEVVNVRDARRACREAVSFVNKGDADVVMKGMIPTAEILKAVLDKESGLRSGQILSHIAAFEIGRYERLLFVTDSVINIAPTLDQKVKIIENCVGVCRSLGIDHPKVACVAAVETVNPKMPATMDAAILSKMADRGQIRDCDIDGPFGLDNAISMEAAAHKGVVSKVAGLADILLVPDIEAGNMLYKSMVYFAGARIGGIVAGAKAPIILTSRADSHESKLFSIALAVVTAHQTYNQGILKRLMPT
jgi:phosphate butyryltransferase